MKVTDGIAGSGSASGSGSISQRYGPATLVLRLQADRYIFRLTGGFFMWNWQKNPGNVVGTHPVPVRWAAGEEGSPAAGGRAATPPGTPAR